VLYLVYSVEIPGGMNKRARQGQTAVWVKTRRVPAGGWYRAARMEV
jgi:hypothetical protein